MVKKAFIIHGWEGYPEEGWRPWLKEELEKRGFKVSIPAMPNTKHPKMSEWVNYLANSVGTPDENCFFIGHSLGCITILRYLETLKKDQKIGGIILVAGFTSNLGFKDLESFFTNQISWEKIKPHCKKSVVIHSDNDPYVSIHYSQIFKNNLDSIVDIERGMKHFSHEDGIIQLPIVLKRLLEISE